MTAPEIIDAANKLVSKPLPKGGGWIVMERDAHGRWKHHTCATNDEARELVKGLRAANAVRLSNQDAGKPWRVDREHEAFVRGNRQRADWRQLAKEIIRRN